jgi:cell division protease FtsH
MKKPPKSPNITYRLAGKNLIELRVPQRGADLAEGATSPEDVSWPDDAFDLDFDEAGGDLGAGPHPEATKCLVAAAFEAAASGAVRRRLCHGQALAVLIGVPDRSWAWPVSDYFGATFGDRWRLIRPSPAHDTFAATGAVLKTEMEIASHLSTGHSVACVFSDASRVPRTMAAAADIEIRIPTPSAAVLRTAIARFTGSSLPKDKALFASEALDLPVLTTCFRPGTGPRRIALRLAQAAAALNAGWVRPGIVGTPPEDQTPTAAGPNSQEEEE